MPLTVKIRLGVTDSSANFEKVVPALIEAGAAAVTIHGRSGEGRYKKAADWWAIERAAAAAAEDASLFLFENNTPIIGNGDILTFFEAQRRMSKPPAISAVMIGRGALIRPWIFAEVKSGGEGGSPPPRSGRLGSTAGSCWDTANTSATTRRGSTESRWFLPSSIDFLNRYRPLPRSVYGERAAAKEAPRR